MEKHESAMAILKLYELRREELAEQDERDEADNELTRSC